MAMGEEKDKVKAIRQEETNQPVTNTIDRSRSGGVLLLSHHRFRLHRSQKRGGWGVSDPLRDSTPPHAIYLSTHARR